MSLSVTEKVCVCVCVCEREREREREREHFPSYPLNKVNPPKYDNDIFKISGAMTPVRERKKEKK